MGEVITSDQATAAYRRAAIFWNALQSPHGHWPAENSGPNFYLPPLVMTLYITGYLNVVFTSEHMKEILRYTYNHQNEDGGWGLHIAGPSRCSLLVSTTVWCVSLERAPMVAVTMHVKQHENGYLITVVHNVRHHGERLGWQSDIWCI